MSASFDLTHFRGLRCSFSKELTAEREAIHPAFSQSPFVDSSEKDLDHQRLIAEEKEKEYIELQRPWDDHILVRTANEVPWIDLVCLLR